ncbi:GDSL-type esterase/lipase family protein [Ruminococcus sp.]|uniref:GDSL-type esterase/lipase family protein n=1 Tax=Ruminococcus sp. TaxID=41978 RepID=UPI0025FA8EB2|nr:GDSL-type esterase/lipase family protein [Ruminococcus sp.]MBR1429656.1 hypothetical protein [Ruminococcus sp.]
MKKIVSAVLAAAMSITAITASPAVYAADKAASPKSMVVLGDSIAAGGLRTGSVKYNYGDICGDYLGCKVSNYAVSGYDTSDLVNEIESFTDTQKKAVSDADVVVISIGGNDMMHALSKYLLDFAGGKTSEKFLNDGYTKDDIPEKPSLTDLTQMLNIRGEGGLMDYMAKGTFAQKREVTDEIGSAFANIYGSGGTFDSETIPNLEKAVEDIKAIAPNTRILVTNVYQPLQLQPSYVEKTYGKQSDYATFLSILRMRCEAMMKEYDIKLNAIDGIEVVDVKSQFTSQEKEPSTSVPGNASYFVDIQTSSLSTADVHPNQKGHIAMAAAILDKIGSLHTDSGLLSKTFNGLSNKDAYPEIALATYKKVAGVKDVVTTTTTSTTSKTTTTTTTTSTTTTTTTTKKTTTSTTTTTTTTAPPVTTTTTTPPAPKIPKGDVNNSGKIDAVDASAVLSEYAKLSGSSGKGEFNAEQTKAADVDDNGKVDAVDASKILSYYAYISTVKSGGIMSIDQYIKSL